MLSDILAELDSVRGASGLFAALGYEPVDRPYGEGLRLVARWRAFKVVGVDAGEPREAVRALARRLGSEGERALAIALGGDELVLAVPPGEGASTTRILAISKRAPSTDSLHLLERLGPDGARNALALSVRLGELLGTEYVGERFFTAFRAALDRMAGSLPKRHAVRDRRLFTLLQLSRVLFLYFVQTKSWLDGRPNFLRTLLDDVLASGKSFDQSALQPLFFGTLNTPASRRSRHWLSREIPYLNGGLFEPHGVERRLRGLHFSNELWRDAFDSVFERFRFTVHEAHESNAVAPDMLGRVFERLMDTGERHDTGTFYTPEATVRSVIDAAIECAFVGRGGLDRTIARAVVAQRRIRARDRTTALRVLKKLRVLDPAAGSGAFLLGAMERLTDIRCALEHPRSSEARCRIRRDVLRHNLFGVDVNPLAVRLAELRLWLAIVADDPTTDVRAVVPLPNLNGIVRQGDALLDPVGAIQSIRRRSIPPGLGRAIRRADERRREVFDARGEARARALEALRAAERDLARPTLEHSLSYADFAIRELEATRESRDLFGTRVGLDSEQQRRHRLLRQERADLKRALRDLEDGAVPFFSFEVHAPEVMAAGGFDIVVGNPPWVRAERLSSGRRAALKRRFSWWQPGGDRGYRHLPDIAVAFLERSLELAAPGGAVGMLVPSKILSAGYAETARRRLVSESTIAYLHRVPRSEAQMFRATTYPLALVVQKSPPEKDHELALGFEGAGRIRQDLLEGSGPWILVPDRARAAIRRMLESGPALGRTAAPSLGVKTGADRVFIGAVESSKRELVLVRFGSREVWLERAMLRPALRGRDVTSFGAMPRMAIVFGYGGRGKPLPTLPALASAYLEGHRSRLERRADYRTGPLWTLFRTKSVLGAHRVVWRDIARFPQAVALDETDAADAIPLNTCYVVSLHDRATALAVAAVLNSTWAAALARVMTDEAQNGYRRINARLAGSLPIPESPKARDRLAELSLLAHQKADVSHRDIDEAVADSLGLDTATRRTLRALAADHVE